MIDEGDEVILSDIPDFYKKTKDDNIKVICLTATADDGDKEGVECKAFKQLGFEIYKTTKETDKPPNIQAKLDLSTLEHIMKVVDQRKMT